MLKNPFKKISIANEYQALVNEINSFESDFKLLTDTEIRTKSIQLRKRYQNKNTLAYYLNIDNSKRQKIIEIKKQ